MFGVRGYSKVARDKWLAESAEAQRSLEPAQPSYGEIFLPATRYGKQVTALFFKWCCVD